MQRDFILIDRSGSMRDIWLEALGSVNTYATKLAEQKVETKITVVLFDVADQSGKTPMSYEVLRDRVAPSEWADLQSAEAQPRGFTPLNDAIAKVVNTANAGNYDKCAIIIMTDGVENSSVEYPEPGGREKVNKLLDSCREKGWQIIFLGANFDNAAQASAYGTQANQQVNAARGFMAQGMTTMAGKRAAYGMAGGQSVSFSDAEKAELSQGMQNQQNLNNPKAKP